MERHTRLETMTISLLDLIQALTVVIDAWCYLAVIIVIMILYVYLIRALISRVFH